MIEVKPKTPKKEGGSNVVASKKSESDKEARKRGGDKSKTRGSVDKGGRKQRGGDGDTSKNRGSVDKGGSNKGDGRKNRGSVDKGGRKKRASTNSSLDPSSPDYIPPPEKLMAVHARRTSQEKVKAERRASQEQAKAERRASQEQENATERRASQQEESEQEPETTTSTVEIPAVMTRLVDDLQSIAAFSLLAATKKPRTYAALCGFGFGSKVRYDENSQLGCAVSALRLSNSSLIKFQALYSLIDTGGLGKISPSEYFNTIGQKQNRYTENLFRHLSLDVLPDEAREDDYAVQSLSFEEWLRVMISFCAFNSRDVLTFVFHTHDVNGNGYVDHDEFLEMANEVHDNDELSTTDTKKLTLEDFDRDFDGTKQLPSLLAHLSTHTTHLSSSHPLRSLNPSPRCSYN
jgi:Ca2+-binding EF-hand superfamily protein